MKTDHLFLILLLMIGIVGCETAIKQVCPDCPVCYTVNQMEFYEPAINQCVEDCATYKESVNAI